MLERPLVCFGAFFTATFKILFKRLKNLREKESGHLSKSVMWLDWDVVA